MTRRWSPVTLHHSWTNSFQTKTTHTMAIFFVDQSINTLLPHWRQQPFSVFCAGCSRTPTEAQCRETIENYVETGLDDGITEKTMRAAFDLPQQGVECSACALPFRCHTGPFLGCPLPQPDQKCFARGRGRAVTRVVASVAAPCRENTNQSVAHRSVPAWLVSVESRQLNTHISIVQWCMKTMLPHHCSLVMRRMHSPQALHCSAIHSLRKVLPGIKWQCQYSLFSRVVNFFCSTHFRTRPLHRQVQAHLSTRMWETQHNNADEDCFKTLILQQTLKIRSQHQGEFCLDVQETDFPHSKAKIISLDVSLRMDGIPALDLWNFVIEVFDFSLNQTNKSKDVREPQ